MPIYEYQCDECGHIFDALQKMSDELLTDCPDCGQAALRKLLSAPNFRLKGGGWYETDFKEKDKRNLAGDPGKDERKDVSKGADKGAEKGADKTKSEKKTPDSKKSDSGGKPTGGSSD